ncbi:MAG TPA: hypothetical protein VGK74_14115 [Symbiobacteriaceae bacterium]|jgi:hypothetical protein
MECQVQNALQRTVKLGDGSTAYVTETYVLVHVLARQGYPFWKRVSLSSQVVPETDDQAARLLIHQAIDVQREFAFAD